MRKDWWFDRHQTNMTGFRIRTTNPIELIEGIIAVKSSGTYFEDYRLHREAKAADANGQPCHTWTKGLLQPRTIDASTHLRIGKEANRLTDSPDLILSADDLAVTYPQPRTCHQCGKALTGRRRQWCTDECRKRHKRRKDA